MAHLLAGRIEEALSWVDKASIHRSDHALPIGILAAIYARAGRRDDARRAIQQLRQLDPGLRVANLREWLPFRRAQDLRNFADALREAGLPQ
jgi:Flp pilus assembly protein TadD